MDNYVSLRFTGKKGRAARLACATLLTVPLAAIVALAPPTEFQPMQIIFRLVGVSIVLCFAILWLRFPWIQVATGREFLRIRSWWSRSCIKRADIVRVEVESYTGFFYVVGWPVVSGALQSGALIATRINGERVRLGGTVTSYRTARLQAEEINRWLGSEVGAGTGERRKRSSRQL